MAPTRLQLHSRPHARRDDIRSDVMRGRAVPPSGNWLVMSTSPQQGSMRLMGRGWIYLYLLLADLIAIQTQTSLRISERDLAEEWNVEGIV